MQLPVLQTMFVPHAWPSDWSVCALHECVVAPVDMQVPATWQASVAVHAIGFAPVHAPALHVSDCVQPLPSLHAVPVGCAFPVSMQTWVPVAHDVNPVWHAFALGTQTTLAMQATQEPPLQTMLVPHDLPLGAAVF
jgi:hypothetical protein